MTKVLVALECLLIVSSLCKAQTNSVNVIESAVADTSVSDGFYMDYYTQTITVEFANDGAARAARIEILPLYHGYQWAILTRWDDNILTDLKMREVLQKYGYRGTFNLNGTDFDYYGPSYGLIAAGDYASLGRELLPGRNSIGGHTLTHPFLTAQCRNEIFHQIMGVRADRENSTDSPINAFAVPFLDWSNKMEGDAVHRDIAEILRRSGYYHVEETEFNRLDNGTEFKRPFSVSNLLPPDGAPINDAFHKFLADKSLQRREPNICFDMHVWYTTDSAWARFENQLERYGHNPEWWYCNQNEYAAYRYQYLHSRVDQAVSGRVVTLKLVRPILMDLNNDIPLTFAIKGVPSAKVVQVICSRSLVKALPETHGEYGFDLYHSESQGLPKAIGYVRNDDNHKTLMAKDTTQSLPGLAALLSASGDTLTFKVKNNSGKDSRNARIAYRLPLEWKPGVVKGFIPDIASGSEWQGTIMMDPDTTHGSFKYTSGTSYYIGQLDFKSSESWNRLYASCEVPEANYDHSYPRDGFHLLGPVTADLQSVEKLAATIAGRKVVPRRVKIRGGELEWRRINTTETSVLDPEVIYTHGEPRSYHREYYLLLTELFSDRAQRLGFLENHGQILEVFLNGTQIYDKKLPLRKGNNDLLIVTYAGEKGSPAQAGGGTFSAKDYGTFFRLVEPHGNHRVTSVRYSPESVKFSGL